MLAQEGLVARSHGASAGDALGAATGYDLRVLDSFGCDAALFGGPDDDLGERVIRTGFGRCPECQHLLRGVAGRGEDFHDLEGSGREGPGLVEDDGVDFGSLLNDLAAPCQQAAARQPADRGDHGRRRGENQGAGAAYDQHGHGTPHALRGVRVARQQVHGSGGEQDRRQEVSGVAIRHADHRRGAMVAGLLDQMDQLGQGRIVPGIGHADMQQAVAVDRAREHLVVPRLIARHGLARDGALVHGRFALDDDAIRRNALAGAHDDDVIRQEVFYVDFDLGTVLQYPRVMRELVDEPVDRALRSPGGPGLQALAEQHDEHRFGGGEVLADSQRRERRDDDREIRRDLAIQQLGDRPVERLVAGEDREDDRGVDA